jgi:hypothetical protein
LVVHGGDRRIAEFDHAHRNRSSRGVAAKVFAEIPGIGGNLVFGAQTAILMREHGLKTIYTRDTDFRRFPFIDVVDPLDERARRGPYRQSSVRSRFDNRATPS